MSGGIAYTLQMVGQKYAQPSVASIVMSLESVFAALAGWIILGEVLKERDNGLHSGIYSGYSGTDTRNEEGRYEMRKK